VAGGDERGEFERGEVERGEVLYPGGGVEAHPGFMIFKVTVFLALLSFAELRFVDVCFSKDKLRLGRDIYLILKSWRFFLQQ
jgi:hypothetical protein